MLKLQYFASLRDQLACDGEELAWETSMNSVTALLTHLRQRNPSWEAALSAKHLMVAVNQEMATLSSPIKDGDEVAFFPPVTGG